MPLIIENLSYKRFPKKKSEWMTNGTLKVEWKKHGFYIMTAGILLMAELLPKLRWEYHPENAMKSGENLAESQLVC